MRAQDDAQRLEEQRRREARRRHGGPLNSEQGRNTSGTSLRDRPIRTDFADDALQDVEDVEKHERQSIFQRVGTGG